MSWVLLAQIIATSGLQVAERVWQKWAAKGEPTQADWDELKALGAKTAQSQVIDALARNGIPLDSPRAVELLALVKGP